MKSEMPLNSSIRKGNDYDLGDAPLPKKSSLQPQMKKSFGMSPQKNKLNVNVNIKDKLKIRKYQTNIEQIDEESSVNNALMQKPSRDRLTTMPAKGNKVEKIAWADQQPRQRSDSPNKEQEEAKAVPVVKKTMMPEKKPKLGTQFSKAT